MRGGEADYAEAMKWATKAADQGIRGGMYLIGMMYDQGEGVGKDAAVAAGRCSRRRRAGMS